MRIIKSFNIIFFVTFLIGYVFVPNAKKENVVSVIAEIPESRIIAPTENKNKPQILEKVDWKEEDDKKLKIKLLETGEGYHSDQVHAKTGETWFGLFKEDDKYFLRSTKLTVHRAEDGVYDHLTGKSVFTNYKAKSVFLLKNAKMLREGKIETVFYSEEIDESTALPNGVRKEFDFNGEKYILRVENKINSEEYPTKGSKLVLSHNGTEQILNYLPDGCDDCSWNLYWVGDLDRDGRLDFYFDLTSHYNLTDMKLFLSSQAEKGKLVKYVANFWTNGC